MNMGLRNRFTLHFLDSILVAIWLLLLGILVLGLVFAIAPGLQTFAQTVLSAQTAFVATYLIFFVASAARFIQSWNASLFLLVTGYFVAKIFFRIFVPNAAVGGEIVLGCFIAVCLIPSNYVWQRIKPLPKRPRIKRRSTKEEEKPIQ